MQVNRELQATITAGLLALAAGGWACNKPSPDCGLVGKQVQVGGHVTDRADLGTPDKDPDLSASDLARVKIDSISKVADSCGESAGK